jgi:hypothetical protein
MNCVATCFTYTTDEGDKLITLVSIYVKRVLIIMSTELEETLLPAERGSRTISPLTRKKQLKNLKRFNVAAGVLHSVSFVGILILASWSQSQGDTFQAEVTTDFRVYADGGTGPLTTSLVSLGTYPLIWIEVPFSLITAIFHFIIAYDVRTWTSYTRLALQEERNPLRWIEYSITASLMTWVILQLSGITNIFMLLVVGVVMNAALQCTGHFMEVLNTPSQIKRRGGKINWLPTVAGWVIFATQWSVIFGYFFTAVTSASDDVPWFVWTVVIGLFGMFSAFGFVQLFHYRRWKFLRLDTGYGAEMAFVVLSLVSKVTLDWILAVGIVNNQIG